MSIQPTFKPGDLVTGTFDENYNKSLFRNEWLVCPVTVDTVTAVETPTDAFTLGVGHHQHVTLAQAGMVSGKLIERVLS